MNINIKKIILPNLPYVLFVWLFDKVGQALRLAQGADLSAKILNLGGGFSNFICIFRFLLGMAFLRSIRVWDYPNKHFSFSGKGPENRKIRKWVLTCCACYVTLSLLPTTKETLVLPNKAKKKRYKLYCL